MPATNSLQPTFTVDGILSSLRILIVDDADSGELLRLTFELVGAEPQAVLSAHEAFNWFVHWQPNLLIISIVLPDEDGCSLIRKVRAFETDRGATIPAIALLTDNQEEARLHALSMGFCRSLLKPLDFCELVSMIATLVRENHLSNDTSL